MTEASLRQARLLAHWAVQVPAAFGHGLLPAQADFSHTSLVWDPRNRALFSGSVSLGGRAPVRVGLRLATLELLVEEPRGSVVAHWPLVGGTLEEGLLSLADFVEQRGGADAARRLAFPEHELPEHPVGSGERFPDAEPAAFAELARWYANAHLVLEETRWRREGAGPVRAWPHHFDIAMLIQLAPGASAEEARTIGVGLSPGDETFAEPYWYVTPWPHPETARLPALAGGGRWHTEDWVGAVLTAGDIVAEPEEQRRQVEAFVETALAAVHELL